MMFILRSADGAPTPASLPIKAARKTPAIVANGAGKTDHFCVGDAADIAALREAGLEVVELRDGWYADDMGGGVAISGQGKYWETRDTPFTVRETSGPFETAAGAADAEQVNIRRAVFGV